MDTLEQWQHREYTGMKPGLERVRRFLKRIGNPQECFKSVHIAGTNGKGSTARILSSILQGSGYKTGLYISPHLYSITERIQVNGLPIGRHELETLSCRYRALAKDCKLTFFEFITGLAFIYFSAMDVDIAVLETGLGGRFDATNVITNPLASIITDVDYDHRHILGDTLAEIAGEKAGIIKNGCPVISGAGRPAASNVIRREARTKDAPFFELGRDFNAKPIRTAWTRRCQVIRYDGTKRHFSFRLPLLGNFQLRNSAMAIAAAEQINLQGLNLNIDFGNISTTGWNGRFDVRLVSSGGKKRTFILDGAHNPGAMRAFTGTWKQSPWGKRKQTFIFGMLQDKDAPAILRHLAPAVSNVILTPVSSPRTMTTGRLYKLWRRWLPHENIQLATSAAEAIRLASAQRVTAITGSLYLVGEILKIIDFTNVTQAAGS
ncbi:MAG: hypothetical protein A2314_07850 [Elusimicrobia bacterium RIFOXYB2_FULL_50_12]|nr:MAG: hypothetical protein A2314_07850 [Elusimicrobia bacterium RIFOXYB2_FULL_50_12]